MSHAEDRYYVPHGSHWPIVGSVGLLFLMVGVSSWLNGGDAGFGGSNGIIGTEGHSGFQGNSTVWN